MCYLLITKKLVDKPDPKIAEKVRNTMLEHMKSNRDGFSLQRPEQNMYFQTMDEDEMEEAIAKTDVDGTIFHARFASAGKVDITNVHGYELDDWTFSHNGGISDYVTKSAWNNSVYTTSGKNQDHTDSKLFFYDLIDEINARGASGHKDIAKAIVAMLNDVTLWGRASLYHKPTDRLFLLGDWHTYKLADDYAIISSADLGTPSGNKITIRGLEFDTYGEHNTLSGELDGVYVIKNFSKPNWSLKFLMADNDRSIDKVCNTTRVASAYESKTNVSTPPLLGQGDDEFDDDGFGRFGMKFKNPATGEIEEYDYMYNIEGDLVEVCQDETGTHDTFARCCNNGTCGMFYKTLREAEAMLDEITADFEEIAINNTPPDKKRTPLEKEEILERLSH